MPFYVDYLLTDAERSALDDNGVEVAEISLGTAAFHRHGIVFSDDDREKVLDVLGLLVNEEEQDDLRTPQGQYVGDDYRLLNLLPLPTPANPIVWGSRRRRYVRKDHFEVLQRDTRLGIILRGYELDESAFRHRAGLLFVNTFSTPSEAESVREEHFRGSYIMQPRGLGDEYIPINDDDGHQLAYFRGDVTGGSLWVLFNPENHERSFLDYVLHSTARLINPEHLGEPIEFSEYMRTWDRERYINLASRRLEQEIDGIDERTRVVDQEVREAQSNLVDAHRQAYAARQRREELHAGDRDEMIRQTSQRLAKEFDDLTSSPDFERIEFDEERVTVQTRPIQLRYEGRIYDMGRYRIQIYGNSLSITNVDNVSVDRNCHPHIRVGGDCCFGSASSDVARLQAEMSYSMLFQFLMRYLEYGYNPADCYTRIEEFPVSSRDENEEVVEVADTDDTESTSGRRRSRRRGRTRRSQASA